MTTPNVPIFSWPMGHEMLRELDEDQQFEARVARDRLVEDYLRFLRDQMVSGLTPNWLTWEKDEGSDLLIAHVVYDDSTAMRGEIPLFPE